MKIKIVDEVIRGPKHKAPERTALFHPKTAELLTDKNQKLEATLKYNIGVLTKNKVVEQDLPEVEQKTKDHKRIMKDKTKGAKLKLKTYKAVLKHIKNKNKNMFRHINKAGEGFKYAMFIYMSHLMNNELVPDTYDYTTLFGLWKGKGSKLDLNMTRYIHGKEWDAKLQEALVSERRKPLITKHCPKMQIGGMKGNSSSENFTVEKHG